MNVPLTYKSDTYFHLSATGVVMNFITGLVLWHKHFFVLGLRAYFSGFHSSFEFTTGIYGDGMTQMFLVNIQFYFESSLFHNYGTEFLVNSFVHQGVPVSLGKIDNIFLINFWVNSS